MPTGYKITNQAGLYFLTLTIVDWIDVFTRKLHVDIFLKSLTYCREYKGLKLYAFVIMTNHVHLMVCAENGNLSDVVRNLKRYTAREILKQIETNKHESRRRWILKQFEFSSRRKSVNNKYQLWLHRNHAIELESEVFINQKLAYIHESPVRAGFFEHADHWLYSSQRNYSGLWSLIDVDLLDIIK